MNLNSSNIFNIMNEDDGFSLDSSFDFKIGLPKQFKGRFFAQGFIVTDDDINYYLTCNNSSLHYFIVKYNSKLNKLTTVKLKDLPSFDCCNSSLFCYNSETNIIEFVNTRYENYIHYENLVKTLMTILISFKSDILEACSFKYVMVCPNCEEPSFDKNYILTTEIETSLGYTEKIFVDDDNVFTLKPTSEEPSDAFNSLLYRKTFSKIVLFNRGHRLLFRDR